MGPTERLASRVCQRYGWSAVYDLKEYWTCTVTVGLHEKRCFVSNDSTDNFSWRKLGIAAASQVALDGLRPEIYREETKPKKDLTEVFTQPIEIYESKPEKWEFFWKHKPSIVGIDTEGNSCIPPVLVQVSTDDYTIIEMPQAGTDISDDLSRLLLDESIVKVFCDNSTHKDKKSLGLNSIPDDLTVGHIVDLEAMATKVLGPLSAHRGLLKIVMLTMPELNVRIIKLGPKKRMNTVQRITLIDQGKTPPVESMDDLSNEELRYAALTAWCTLQAYKRMREADS